MIIFKKRVKLYLAIGILALGLGIIAVNYLLSQLKNQSTNQLVNEIVGRCQAHPNWKICYSRELEAVNKKYTFKETLAIMDQLKKKDGKTYFCHILAHNVIASEVEKDPANWSNVLKYLDDPYSCNTGFIHGLVEAEKKFNPDIKFDEKGIEILCQKIFNATRTGYYYPCAHAAGHVLLVETSAKIDPAAEICNKLPRHMQDPCLEGIFMEYINRPNLTFHGLTTGPLKKDEVAEEAMVQLCNKYSDKTAVGCWKALALVINETRKADIIKIKEVCNKSRTADGSRECYFRAFDYALNEDIFNPLQINGLCKDYENSPQEFKCYENAIISLLYKKDRNQKLAEALCKTASNTFKSQCNSIKQKYFGSISTEKNTTDVKTQIKSLESD